jgi:hypothetical protein
LYCPAIALENFAIVIRPRDEIFEDCEAYQILHKDSGQHIATFSITQPAIDCLQELERVAGFSGKIKIPISRSLAALIQQIVAIFQRIEREHPEYWEDEEEE